MLETIAQIGLRSQQRYVDGDKTATGILGERRCVQCGHSLPICFYNCDLMVRAIKPSETLDDQVNILLSSMRVRVENTSNSESASAEVFLGSSTPTPIGSACGSFKGSRQLSNDTMCSSFQQTISIHSVQSTQSTCKSAARAQPPPPSGCPWAIWVVLLD
uniref:Uncharacterized protein n=1 Tax=Ditylenchus dipsaci TaxID=166011 RepID=A0A915DJZ9_9BILA